MVCISSVQIQCHTIKQLRSGFASSVSPSCRGMPISQPFSPCYFTQGHQDRQRSCQFFQLPRPLSPLGFSSPRRMYVSLKTWSHPSNVSAAPPLDSLSCLASGLLWWWLAQGRTLGWSRTLWNMAQIHFWRTKMAGTASTLPAEKVTLRSSSTCSPFAQIPGRQKAKLAELLCTRQVWSRALQARKHRCAVCLPWHCRMSPSWRVLEKRSENKSSFWVFWHTLSFRS